MELSRPGDAQIVAASRPRAGQDVSAAPVRELERTVAGFQAILTDEDRKKLQQLKATSHDSQSIITFTAELDLLDKNRRGKSVASRLASFLQTIEQFTPIVDTYIQSNPDIAGIIWGSIKLTFLSELRSYVEDIRAKAEEVQGDIHLVKAQCDREEQQHQNTERQEATNHRKRMLAWTSKSTIEMEALHVQRRRNASEQKRRRLLEELSSFNFTSAFNSTRNKRHIGTAKWVFDTPEFQKWVGSDGPHVLHVTGKIGSGKTVLSSSVVEKLSQIRPPQQFVSFFFIRFDDPLSLDADTIIRSCVQQLLSAIVTDDLDQRLASELDKHLSEAKLALFSLDQLSRLYSYAAKAIKSWFIVLDGLDECNTGQHADIGAYVDDIIIEKLSTGELVVSDPSLIDEILKTIASKEQGMFLWAFLAIEDICSGKSDKEIRQALKDIPSDLPTTFDRALSRIVQKRNQQIAKKAFMWTKAVSQSLTLSQFREALSIEIGQHTLRQEDLISGIERLPVWCENLLYVEETDNTVRFSHHSIQEFLLVPDSGENGDLHIDSNQCDKLAGDVCITYVNLDNFQTALAERKREPLSSSAIKIDPSGIAEQTIQSAIQGGVGTRVGRLARQFVKTSNPKKISTQRDFSLSSSMSVTSKAQGNPDYPFLEYASTKWFKHTKYIDKNETEIWRLFGQLVQKPLEHSQGEPWHSTEWKNEAMAGFPNHDDARSEFYCRVIRTMNSGEMHESDDGPDDGPNFSQLCLAFMYAELNGYYALAYQAPHELMLDICQVLKTGYRRTIQSHLQAFAIVTEALADERHGDMPGILDLSLTCREEAYTLFEAKNIHRMLLIDVLIQGLLSTEPLYKGIVSNSIASFVEYETTPTFRFHSQILEPPSSMPEHRLIAYTICFLVLLDGERPPAPAPDISVLREYRRFKKLMNLHGETIAAVFRRLVIPALWPTYMASYIVQTLFGEFLKYDVQHIAHAHEDSFREAVWNNNWDIAAALLELQPTSLDRLSGLGYFSYIREAVRCQNCWRCTQNVVRQLTSSEMHRYSFRLCANHVNYFNRIAGLLGGIYDAGKGQLLCPGHSTDALPEREGKLKRPGF
ncbi:hypothetical protein FOC1_g10015135 [Fusarium oxysporum f. sp. cubense race 1]|uniref:Uncharacterized protein n=1 Tax=Fusarium oxysporum f. sp. cubense (strain race 1) TaxID=1229664 RepID=N4TFQ8_FUSC1|nr:hypothetical protein FOC1_g10015135 [Fusarium oxysporum f. sp. cubense race 1]